MSIQKFHYYPDLEFDFEIKSGELYVDFGDTISKFQRKYNITFRDVDMVVYERATPGIHLMTTDYFVFKMPHSSGVRTIRCDIDRWGGDFSKIMGGKPVYQIIHELANCVGEKCLRYEVEALA